MKGDNPGGPDLISWRALKAGLRPSSESGKIPPGGPDESSRPTPRAFQTAIHSLDSHSHPLSYRDHPIFAHKHIHTHTPCILRRLYISTFVCYLILVLLLWLNSKSQSILFMRADKLFYEEDVQKMNYRNITVSNCI